MLKIEFKNMPNVQETRLLYGNKTAHLEVYGPFDVTTECKITYYYYYNNIPMTHLSKFSIGLYERQTLLPLGICGNINRL